MAKPDKIAAEIAELRELILNLAKRIEERFRILETRYRIKLDDDGSLFELRELLRDLDDLDDHGAR